MDKVWLVSGASGEFVDYSNWVVCAILDEESARAYAEKANQWAKDNGVYDGMDCYEKHDLKNPYDEYMSISYTGVIYGAYDVPLRNPEQEERD